MTVYQAINAVQADLSKLGISKKQTNSFDNYKFRGIDDVYNALSPLMAKHGLCILPRVLKRESVERETNKGGTLFYVVIEAEFDFVSAEDGSVHTVRMIGEAMDRGDKATSKAMSAAYKYAAFQVFAIPTEGDNDPDASSYEVKPRSQSPRNPTPAGKKEVPQSAYDALDSQWKGWIDHHSVAVNKKCKEDGAVAAREYVESLKKEHSLTEQQVAALWSKLDESTRNSLRAAQQK